MLEEYFEGMLPTRQQGRVSVHLRECAACAAELAQIEKVAASLAAVPRIEPSAELLGAITQRAAALPAPGARRALVSGWQRLGVLAATFLAAMAGLSYGVPLLWPRASVSLTPVLTWCGEQAASGLAWLRSVYDAAALLFGAGLRVAGLLDTAAVEAAPTVGLYVVGELALLIGIMFVVRRSRRRVPAGVTLVV